MTKHKRPSLATIRRLAKAQYYNEGTIEIDDKAPVSCPEMTDTNGAYVQAWVWVEFNDKDNQ